MNPKKKITKIEARGTEVTSKVVQPHEWFGRSTLTILKRRNYNQYFEIATTHYGNICRFPVKHGWSSNLNGKKSPSLNLPFY